MASRYRSLSNSNLVYFRKAKGEEIIAYGKIERDFRDLSAFPEIKEELAGVYNAWKTLIKEYEKMEFK